LNDQFGAAAETFDEIVIHEEFTPRTNIDWLGGLNAGRYQKNEGGKSHGLHAILFRQSISRGLYWYWRGP